MIEKIVISIFAGIVLCCFYMIYRHLKMLGRQRYIENYTFPERLTKKLLDTYPHLTKPQAAAVIEGLREYFTICNIAGKRVVSMPSQAVDVVWHEFILFTRAYQLFCQKGLGRFLHHTPAEAMQSPTVAQEGIKTAWRLSCHRTSEQREAPTTLPILFAMDAQLNIPDGFHYDIDCLRSGSDNYCATHIGCGSGCSGCSSDDGCGGGCGGD